MVFILKEPFHLVIFFSFSKSFLKFDIMKLQNWSILQNSCKIVCYGFIIADNLSVSPNCIFWFQVAIMDKVPEDKAKGLPTPIWTKYQVICDTASDTQVNNHI